MVKLALIAILGLTGCCSSPIYTAIDQPPRPTLIDAQRTDLDAVIGGSVELPREVLDRLPPEARDAHETNTLTILAAQRLIDIWSSNDLALKQYAKRLEARIRIQNNTVR